MTAATLKQIAAAAAIEKRAIHMVSSSLAGSIGFHCRPNGKPLTTQSAFRGSAARRPMMRVLEEYDLKAERLVSSPRDK
ncbi:MAG TPA: hypothetical protein VIM38_12675 [Alphaproteobacteria bacterium]|jgi:hypothetical protein